jgi:phage head maturation protease
MASSSWTRSKALDTFKTIKGTGELQEWSYGFNVLETGEVTEAMRQAGVWRVIKKSEVYEVCPVMLGAGVGTETVDIKSAPSSAARPDRGSRRALMRAASLPFHQNQRGLVARS